MEKTPNAAGYRRPPKNHCWKKGPSGNPKGRPRGYRSLAAALAAVLHENVSACADSEEREMTKLEAVTRQPVDKAMAGDARVTQLLLGDGVEASPTQKKTCHGPRLRATQVKATKPALSVLGVLTACQASTGSPAFAGDDNVGEQAPTGHLHSQAMTGFCNFCHTLARAASVI